MRNPKRIDIILERLRNVWNKYPDLRLGQLIGNLRLPDIKFYYIEDEEFIKIIENFYMKKVEK